MATRKAGKKAAAGGGGRGASAGAAGVSSPIEQLLLAALERSGDANETGRYLVTFKEGAGTESLASLGAQGLRVADARDFSGQAGALDEVGDADAFVFPEIGVALISGDAAQERSLGAFGAEAAADSPFETVEPEPFVFTAADYGAGFGIFGQGVEEGGGAGGAGEQLRGAARILEAIAREIGAYGRTPQLEAEEEVAVLGATWGLNACRVPPSTRSGAGIRVAVLDTGMDLGHPDFAGRQFVTASFVGEPVQDLHGHGTHCIGTACGPKAPPGTTPRYGIGYQTTIFVGKVLTNSGFSVGSSVLNGMNWAIANNCQVISMSLGGGGGPFAFYTAAGQAALNKGLLIVAAAGNNYPGTTLAPANSPTIMSVASVDQNLAPSNFSAQGKIEIAGPGRDIFSSVPRPTRYGIKSGTSMATPHVAGCAALWAQTSPLMRGKVLWDRLRATAKALPYPVTRVGRGLVQAPA